MLSTTCNFKLSNVLGKTRITLRFRTEKLKYRSAKCQGKFKHFFVITHSNLVALERKHLGEGNNLTRKPTNMPPLPTTTTPTTPTLINR